MLLYETYDTIPCGGKSEARVNNGCCDYGMSRLKMPPRPQGQRTEAETRGGVRPRFIDLDLIALLV